MRELRKRDGVALIRPVGRPICTTPEGLPVVPEGLPIPSFAARVRGSASGSDQQFGEALRLLANGPARGELDDLRVDRGRAIL
jgi:hypothetical protein